MLKLRDYQRELVNRARQSLAKGNLGVLIVSPPGSGKSVVIAEIAKLATQKGGQVLFFVHRKELVQQIKQTFLRQGVDMSGCTIDTVMRVKNRLGKIPKPTLIIVDEGHHSRAKTYQEIFNYYADVPRLGFTATPWRLSGQGFGDIYSDMIEGESVEWLINHKHLAPYTMFGKQLGDFSKLKIGSTGDYTGQSVKDFEKTVIHGDIVKSWLQFAQNRKTIVYAFSRQFSQTVADEFNKSGIVAAHVDSKTPTAKRDQVMADFKAGKIKVLCNVDLVSEGFDVPDCSCVVMLRPTESLVLYLQQSMRSMRYKPDKQAVIIDQVSNFAKFGLPDDDRKWNLQGHDKKRKNEVNTVTIKSCPQCFAVMKSGLLKCPYCQYDFSREIEQQRKIKVEEQERLEEIKRQEAFKVSHILAKKVSDLKTIEELTDYQAAKGWKPGWVYHMAKKKGLLY